MAADIEEDDSKTEEEEEGEMEDEADGDAADARVGAAPRGDNGDDKNVSTCVMSSVSSQLS